MRFTGRADAHETVGEMFSAYLSGKDPSDIILISGRAALRQRCAIIERAARLVLPVPTHARTQLAHIDSVASTDAFKVVRQWPRRKLWGHSASSNGRRTAYPRNSSPVRRPNWARPRVLGHQPGDGG